MIDDPNSLPKREAGDYLHTAAKAGLSMIPAVGGPAAELFALVLAPPMERRRDAWLEDLYGRLKQVEQRVESFHFDDLQNNDAFVSATIQATRIAIGTHQKEKREYLANAVVNIAMGMSTDDFKQQMFLSAVEAFTPAHVKALDLIGGAGGRRMPWEENSIGLGHRNYGSALGILVPEIKGQPSLISAIFVDLRNRGFSNLGGPEQVYPQGGLIRNLGNEFLSFVLTSDDRIK